MPRKPNFSVYGLEYFVFFYNFQRIEQERAAANGADRNLSVCDICGTYLSEAEVGDRLVNHTEGKQHRGFALLRERIAAYNVPRYFAWIVWLKALPPEQKYRPPSSERTDRYSQSRDPLDVRGSSRERPSRERRRSSSRDRHSDRYVDCIYIFSHFAFIF